MFKDYKFTRMAYPPVSILLSSTSPSFSVTSNSIPANVPFGYRILTDSCFYDVNMDFFFVEVINFKILMVRY